MFKVEFSPLLERNEVGYCDLCVCEWNFKLKKQCHSNYSSTNLFAH